MHVAVAHKATVVKSMYKESQQSVIVAIQFATMHQKAFAIGCDWFRSATNQVGGRGELRLISICDWPSGGTWKPRPVAEITLNGICNRFRFATAPEWRADLLLLYLTPLNNSLSYTPQPSPPRRCYHHHHYHYHHHPNSPCLSITAQPTDN
jgi:hypothetical protein